MITYHVNEKIHPIEYIRLYKRFIHNNISGRDKRFDRHNISKDLKDSLGVINHIIEKISNVSVYIIL